MLTFASLIILSVATASIPLLLLAFARPEGARQRQRGKANTTWPVIAGLLIVTGAFCAKVFLVSRLEQESEQVPLVSASRKTVAATYPPTPFPFKDTSTPGYTRPYHWQALPAVAPYPPDNPTTPAKVALGRKLFNDRNLSADRTVSCASCHNLLLRAGADGKKVAQGIGGKRGPRNTPTVWNAAFQKKLFWDGRASSLEQQALQPILNPIEMGMTSEQAIIDRLTANPDYRSAFSRAFGEDTITIDRVTKALASYQRTLVTNDSPYDDFVRGDSNALNREQLNGMALFERSGCVLCHSGPNFSTASLYGDNPPLRLFPANPSPLTEDLGLTDANTGKPAAWRVPSLRNVALTGPWLHNGEVKTLEDVVRIMATAQLGKSRGKRVVWSGNQLIVAENPPLTDSDVRAIVAFLKTLSSRQLATSGATAVTDQ